jgi:hypothetical protein
LFVVGLLMGGGIVAAILLGQFLDISLLESLARGLKLSFLTLVAGALVLDLGRSRKVDLDVVFGACCVYLMIGLIWAAGYALLEAAAPGSFDFGPLTDPSADSAQARLVYFSFVTMTTLGYGDVTPLAPTARSLAALQGLVGQLYLAIVIARLVGLEIATRLEAER